MSILLKNNINFMKDYFMTDKNLFPLQNLIYEIRGHRVMLDNDLAKLYGVPVKVLNQSIKRNIERFPEDFMFELTKQEQLELVTNCDHLAPLKFRPTLIKAFTEEGVAMLSTVLRSQQAIQMSINIMRAFVLMRDRVTQITTTNQQIRELKQMLMLHIDNTDNRFGLHEDRINRIIRALNNLTQKSTPNRKIGFNPDRK